MRRRLCCSAAKGLTATIGPMKAAAQQFVNTPFIATAVCVLPAVAAGATNLLDQSMRRPSLVRVVMQSLQMVW